MKKNSIFIIFFASAIMSFCLTQDIKASIKRGKLVYEKNCLVCHQKNGEGVPRMNPPLIKTPQVLGDKNKLINIVIKGTNEGITINGETYDNPMPAQPQLSNQDVADVLTYIRNSFGNKAGAITVEEVNGIRKK